MRELRPTTGRGPPALVSPNALTTWPCAVIFPAKCVRDYVEDQVDLTTVRPDHRAVGGVELWHWHPRRRASSGGRDFVRCWSTLHVLIVRLTYIMTAATRCFDKQRRPNTAWISDWSMHLVRQDRAQEEEVVASQPTRFRGVATGEKRQDPNFYQATVRVAQEGHDEQRWQRARDLLSEQRAERVLGS